MSSQTLDERLIEAWTHSDEPLTAIAAMLAITPAQAAARLAHLAKEGRIVIRRDLWPYYEVRGAAAHPKED